MHLAYAKHCSCQPKAKSVYGPSQRNVLAFHRPPRDRRLGALERDSNEEPRFGEGAATMTSSTALSFNLQILDRLQCSSNNVHKFASDASVKENFHVNTECVVHFRGTCLIEGKFFSLVPIAFIKEMVHLNHAGEINALQQSLWYYSYPFLFSIRTTSAHCQANITPYSGLIILHPLKPPRFQ